MMLGLITGGGSVIATLKPVIVSTKCRSPRNSDPARVFRYSENTGDLGIVGARSKIECQDSHEQTVANYGVLASFSAA
jgi:hypothetical protein